jgi:hypothetical protein
LLLRDQSRADTRAKPLFILNRARVFALNAAFSAARAREFLGFDYFSDLYLLFNHFSARFFQ